MTPKKNKADLAAFAMAILGSLVLLNVVGLKLFGRIESPAGDIGRQTGAVCVHNHGGV